MTIYGNQPRKSNSRRIVKSGGVMKVIKSVKAMTYENEVMMQFTGKHRLRIEGLVDLKAVVYYQTKLSDLSLELIMDILERGGIYLNDRQVMRYETIKGHDKENPRIEILVTEITQDELQCAHNTLLDEIKNKKFL